MHVAISIVFFDCYVITDTKQSLLTIPAHKCFGSLFMFHANPKYYCNQSNNIYFVKPTTQSFPYFLIRNPNRQQIHQKEERKGL